MPELPEVQTIRSQLLKTVAGKRINSVIVRRASVLDGIRQAAFIRILTGNTIKDILRKGKLLIFVLKKEYLLVHLRMSGWFHLSDTEEKNARIVFMLSGGKVLNYMDQRCLGKVSLLKDYTQDDFYKRLGLEITEIGFDDFSACLDAKKNAPVKSFLLEQGHVCGIGNIYACEGLFHSKIHPQRRNANLSGPERKALLVSLKKVIQEAIRREGSSVNTFRNIFGQKGSMAQSHKVYGRQGQKCECGKGVIVRSVIAGRGTFFCPVCQK